MDPIFILVVLAVVAAIVVSYVISAKRRKELAEWAAGRGLRFDPGKDHSLDHRHAEFKCLQRGHNRYAHNIISGQCDGLDIQAFDYHYVTGSGKNRSTHRFSAVIVVSPLPLKPLFIRREGIFDKVTEFFGLDDIDFESAEFSRKFFVKAPDRKWAYDVIHQRMMEYLLAGPKLAVQFDYGHVIAWNNGRRMDGAGYEQAISHIREILNRLPEYLVRQQKDLTRP